MTLLRAEGVWGCHLRRTHAQTNRVAWREADMIEWQKSLVVGVKGRPRRLAESEA